jgi:hypothetical protein
MTVADTTRGSATGFTTTLDGDSYLRIENVDRLAPFLMTLPSDTDLWMFVSSLGGLTAGRGSPDGSLFPYLTADLLHDAHHTTGPITLLRVRRGTAPAILWQPFAPGEPAPGIERILHKNTTGDRLVFEEIHHGLGLGFRYRWGACGAFGHVRTASLVERQGEPLVVEVLDGLRNLLPAGVTLTLLQHSSVLVDAYKHNECDARTGIGIFSLASRITDRAEPGESLRANVAAVAGLPGAAITLAAHAVDAFRRGEPVPVERLTTGQRGHYLALATLELDPYGSARWHVVADALRSQAQVAALLERWRAPEALVSAIDEALAASHARLRSLVARADGLQVTGEPAAAVHHFANVLFNVMRGGVFVRDHEIPLTDFAAFVERRDRRVATRAGTWLASLPAPLTVDRLREAAAATGDADLERLAHEYLPIHFGRRHGDPSRPWNRFDIHGDGPAGEPVLGFEGNWRDIFQNWEALALSFPDFLPNLVAVFVNASTVDGFNPYRLTRDGVEWETDLPGHPWSNFGYWGDHQIVYLLRFLEALDRASPGTLEAMLSRRIFSYADVPYRIAPFAQILEDPRATLTIDYARAAHVDERVKAFGTDGRRVTDPAGRVVHVTLLEKLLVPVLAKLSNLVPDAGIWMNTQRPEWNDANNALVGYGVSVVTLAHLRRHLAFLSERLATDPASAVTISREVAEWLGDVRSALQTACPAPGSGPLEARARMALVRTLGESFSRYRERVYATGLGDDEWVTWREVSDLLEAGLAHVDHALDQARRGDGLYHAYHVLELDFERDALEVHPLGLMLEGQVAALSSGRLGSAEAVLLLDALFASSLYRHDQDTFLLYPVRALPRFLERNVVAGSRARDIRLLEQLLAARDEDIVARDVTGTVRFHSDFRHAGDLAAALDQLAARPEWREAVARDRDAVLALYEEVFRHRAFTGRSGTMYGYEGIGSIYWHMVAKLLVAVQETHDRAVREGDPEATVGALASHYRRVRAGLGFTRSAEAFGAFPTDPYSHTPAHAGAQQPGMTGQVKEEILTRFGELGMTIEGGRVAFRPQLLARAEFLAAPAVFESVAGDGTVQPRTLPVGSLGFTVAGTPVVYTLTDGQSWARVVGIDGTERHIRGGLLDVDTSRALLARTGTIAHIEVGIPERMLARGRELETAPTNGSGSEVR